MLKDKKNETTFIYQSKRVCGPSESSFNLSSEIWLATTIELFKSGILFFLNEINFYNTVCIPRDKQHKGWKKYWCCNNSSDLKNGSKNQ